MGNNPHARPQVNLGFSSGYQILGNKEGLKALVFSGLSGSDTCQERVPDSDEPSKTGASDSEWEKKKSSEFERLQLCTYM